MSTLPKIQCWFFAIGILIYAGFSSPTPDQIGFIEYSIAALIFLSIGFIQPFNGLVERNLPSYLFFHRLFFGYMITIPLLLGIINGYDLSDIIRDSIPITFLILPLVFYHSNFKHFDDLLVISGAIFALRYCIPYLYPPFSNGDDLLYLANSPLIPFTAIIGFSWISDPQKTLISKRMIGLTFMIVAFTAMILMMQRAPVILSALVCLGILTLRSAHKPLQSMVIGSVLIITLLSILPIFIDVYQNMIAKTSAVGFNNRIEEFQAVIEQTTIFGLGWGSLFQSPAVADIWVRYTHNMISYYWLKAGIIGAILTLIFIYYWGKRLLILFRHSPAFAVAIIVPFIIHVTLYTGFKTLDFALLLTLIMLWSRTDKGTHIKNQS